MEQQPLGCFNAHRGEVFARRYANGCGKGAHQMALGHAQPLAQLFHTVQARVVGADILNGGLYQRRQGRGGAVGVRKLTQQCVGQLAARPAVGGFFLGQTAHQLGSSRAGAALGKEGQFVQPGQKLGSRLPGKLDAEQMAAALETRQTHSPSPVRVRGAESCTSSSAAGAAMVFQSNSNI